MSNKCKYVILAWASKTFILELASKTLGSGIEDNWLGLENAVLEHIPVSGIIFKGLDSPVQDPQSTPHDEKNMNTYSPNTHRRSH